MGDERIMTDVRRSRFAFLAGAVLSLALALAGCGSTAVPTYSLSAPGSFTAKGGGSGQMVVQTDGLAAGAYMYALIVDGLVVETKQMVMQR